MKALHETMRWYGPKDVVQLSDIRQAGATGVVTALHDIPNGAIWPRDAILERKQLIEAAGLQWLVVESVPVHEDIKTRTGNFAAYIDNYKKTIENLASAGIKIICYNFMPVLDWTRTDLAYELSDGSLALRFQLIALAAFDCFLLNRVEAQNDYDVATLKEAEMYFSALDEDDKKRLSNTILAGLPGAEEGYSLSDFKLALDRYANIDSKDLAENLSNFLGEIIPVAEAFDVKMAIHPDDPPFPILGLPRVVSTADDIERILKKPQSPSNGITFCAGSFGVREDNNLPDMVDLFGDRIYFAHLRSTMRDKRGSFYEAHHLGGDVPMYEVVRKLMLKNSERIEPIPMRPDHGHQLMDDLEKTSNPGYSAIGRLKGLAELRGLMYAIAHQAS